MATIDNKSLSERDICTKFITPAVERAGWDLHLLDGTVSTSPEAAGTA